MASLDNAFIDDESSCRNSCSDLSDRCSTESPPIDFASTNGDADTDSTVLARRCRIGRIVEKRISITDRLPRREPLYASRASNVKKPTKAKNGGGATKRKAVSSEDGKRRRTTRNANRIVGSSEAVDRVGESSSSSTMNTRLIVTERCLTPDSVIESVYQSTGTSPSSSAGFILPVLLF